MFRIKRAHAYTWYSPKWQKMRRYFFFFAHTKKVASCSHSFAILNWATDVTWSVLPMSIFMGLGTLLSMEGQRALRFHQKLLKLCSEDERMSYGFGAIWGWAINDRIFLFGWTIPLRVEKKFTHLKDSLDTSAQPIRSQYSWIPLTELCCS